MPLKKSQLKRLLKAFNGAKIIPQVYMESGSAPIILVDHATLDQWVKAGIATIHNIGEIKINGDQKTEAPAVSDGGG